MKYFKALDLRFSDPKMEAEYTTIKNQYAMRDFIVTLLTILVVTFTVVIDRLIRDDMTEVIISGTTCAVLLALLVGGRYIRREYLKYITIFAIFCYNMYRVVITESVYSTVVKASLFYGGYTYAVLQMILISRIPGNYFKILVVAGLYVFRFVLFTVWIDSRSLQVATLIRGVIIDAFILYYFYINDKTERGVFQNFHDSREELKKFKELLDDSLPLSVTVIDNDTGQFLFANKTFSGMFDRDTHRLDPPNMTDPSAVPMISSQAIRPLKPHISFLNVDQATVREMGSLPQTIGSSEFNNNGTVYLKEIMENLTKSDSLHEKVLCFSATYPMPNQRKSYEITLKKIKWNKVEAIAIILSDITDHENLLALKMANLNKDKILATVSHELRTPLGAIVGLIGMAEQGVKDQKALEYLSLSKDTAELLLTLVNSHLDLQQINAGKLQLNPSKINLRKAMTDISRLFLFQTSKKGILLELVISKDVPKIIVTDENRLKQILINLIGNAIKFTFSGGIKIEICKDFEIPNCLQISVVDTGIGIKDSDKENLFQMYTRLEEGRKINKNGVGLGLMISNALAALLSGKTDGRGIEVTSQQGVGSRFYFRVLEDLGSVIELNKNSHADDRQQLEINELKKEILPEIKYKKEVNREQDKESFNREMSEDSLPPVDSLMASYTFRINMHDHKQKRLPRSLLPEDYSFEPRSQYKKDATKDLENNNDTSIQSISKVNSAHHSPPKDHILVVDDNPFNILVTENLLTDLGYLVRSALGGKEAIEIVKAFNNQGKRLKCILMDCLMPEMDGYETSIILKQLMAKGEIETVPIIALTANSNSAEEVKKCLDCGMEGYLTKPIIKANLIKTLSSFR